MPLITIDAGHGGEDPGATVGELREADIALAFADELGRQLIRRGATIALTREDDRTVKLARRCRMANELGAAAFVSIHCNASSSSAPHGPQVFYCKGSVRGHALANRVWAEMEATADTSGTWAGVYTDESPMCGNRRLYVLRGTRMPAILVELGFITHACDRGNLVDPEWRRRVCGAIAEGVVEWYEREVQP